MTAGCGRLRGCDRGRRKWQWLRPHSNDSGLRPYSNDGGCGLARNGSGRTVYIPVVEEFIVELDEPRRRIIFDLPEGLLDLND